MNKTICWFCEKEFEYDGEQYRDVNCPFCGVENSIYNPNQVEQEFNKPNTTEEEWLKEKEENMGELKDLARKQSKFLMLEVGDSIEAIFTDYKIIPSPYDPEKEIVQYRFKVDNIDKFFTNGSSALMRAFDEIPKGSKVKITRIPMVDKAGKTVEGKSSYKVEKIG